jgi:hypothetical protein
VVSGLVLARKYVPPHGTLWQVAGGGSLSVPCSPRSGVFIAVVAGHRWTPLSPLSVVLSLPATEVSSKFPITS